MNDERPLESGVFTIDELIDTCLSPFHIDVNLLHILLKIIASKLKLQSVRVDLSSPRLFTEIRNIVSKTKETIEGFRILEGGARRPFKLSACKLERIGIDADPPTELVYRISKKSSDAKDVYTNLLPKGSPEIQLGLSGIAETDAGAIDQLSMAKRLETCEVEIRKLNELIDTHNFRELEKPVRELENDEVHDGGKRSRSQDHQSIFKINESTIVSKLTEDQNVRENIGILNEKTADMRNQLCQLISTINDLRKDLRRVKEDNKSLSRTLQNMPNSDKVDYYFKEICNLQKIMVQNTDKVADLNKCSTKLNETNKALDSRLQELEKLQVLVEKVMQLEEISQNTIAEFDVFTERLEHLKIVKSDREEMEYLLQSKANREDLHEVVSLELFNRVNYDLSTSIDQSFETIASAEINWKKCWYEIQSKLEEKMDRSEKASIMKLINQKVRQQAFQGIRDEPRSPDLHIHNPRNVRCIYSSPKINADCATSFPDAGRIQKMGPETQDERKRFCGGSHTVISPRKKLEQQRSVPIYFESSMEAPNLIDSGNRKINRVAKSEGDGTKQIFPKVMYPSRKANTWEGKPSADDKKKKIVDNMP